MTAPTFFRELRKTSVFFLLVFLVFVIHRIVNLFEKPPVEDFSMGNVKEIKKAESVVCHNIVGGAAFGVDSVFDAYTRVYFYSQVALDSITFLEHRWYCGVDTMFVGNALCKGNICTSSIAPERLKAGEWSVDLVQGKKILDSKQFLVEAPDF